MNILETIKHKLAVASSKRRERAKEKLRSPHWASVRDHYLKQNNKCKICGGEKELQVHHIVPFNTAPSLELNPDNLITLCMGDRDCHLGIGHGGSFEFYNPELRQDVNILSSDISKFQEIKLKAKFKRMNNK